MLKDWSPPPRLWLVCHSNTTSLMFVFQIKNQVSWVTQGKEDLGRRDCSWSPLDVEVPWPSPLPHLFHFLVPLHRPSQHHQRQHQVSVHKQIPFPCSCSQHGFLDFISDGLQTGPAPSATQGERTHFRELCCVERRSKLC